MGFLNLDLYRHPSGKRFDPEKVIQRVKAAFPETRILPGDQLAEAVRRAEASGAPHQIVDSLAASQRPTGLLTLLKYPCRRLGSSGGWRAVGVQFLFDESLPEAVRARLIDFLKSLGLGRLEASTSAGQGQIVCDLAGPSDCVGGPEEQVG